MSHGLPNKLMENHHNMVHLMSRQDLTASGEDMIEYTYSAFWSCFKAKAMPLH